MIQGFRGKETEKVWNENHARKLPGQIQDTALRKLQMLNAATVLSDLKAPPNNHLEALKDDRKGQHSIRINRQWRVCFRWREGNAYDVEIVDFH